MNSRQSLIINTRNHDKRASLAMPVQLNAFTNSSSINHENCHRFYSSIYNSMFDEQLNCINRQNYQRYDDHQYRRPFAVNNTSSNFRSTILTNNYYYHHYMKRYQRHISNLSSSKQRMMIDIDPQHTIGLMQQHEQNPLSSPLVKHFQPPITTDASSSLYDNDNHEKKLASSSRIRLGLRCLCSLEDKQKQLFDEVFSNNEPSVDISERILNDCILRLTKHSSNTLLIISGQYKDVHQFQTTILSSTFIRLDHFVKNDHDKNFDLCISIEKFSNYKSCDGINLLSSKASINTSQYETCQYINNLCYDHRYNPLLITFHLMYRSTHTNKALFHILFTNDNDNGISIEQFSDIFMSLALSFSSSRQQKQTYNISKKKRNLSIEQSLSSLLREYILNNTERYSKDLLYIFANAKDDKQLKYWTKIQRLFRMKRNRLKMPRDRPDIYGDSSSVETVINRRNEEIWIDGPLSSPINKAEIWIDGPLECYSSPPKVHRKRMKIKSHTNSHRQNKSKAKTSSNTIQKHPISPCLSSTVLKQEKDESVLTNCDTASMISSHCHVPVLPLFKDHTLLPFRSNQITPIAKSLQLNSSIPDLKLSRNNLNDDMEMLEKTLETLLVPSPIVPINNVQQQSTLTKSLSRINQISSSMSKDEKTRRLSRIVSPTRFDRVFRGGQSTSSPHNSQQVYPKTTGLSVPNSPIIQYQSRQSRTPRNSTPNSPHRSLLSTKKTKCGSETNHSTTTTTTSNQARPSIFHRLFRLRSASIPRQESIPIVIESSPISPLISPLTVTLDSHDDLMPMTTSSTTSSASGRASSSGYESLCNTAFDEMIASLPIHTANEENPSKTRNKSTKKDDRRSNPSASMNSPNLRDKSHRQQRMSQLRHRQNELKLELSITKTLLLMDKNPRVDHIDLLASSLNNSILSTNASYTMDEDDLENEIQHLEKRLASAKLHLYHSTNNKNEKQFTSKNEQ